MPHNNTLRHGTKLFSILKHFSFGSSLHRFQAERLGEHCLNSTVSAIAGTYGIYFQKKWIKVPTNYGKPVRVIRYWLEGDDLERAVKLVGSNFGAQLKKPTPEINQKQT